MKLVIYAGGEYLTGDEIAAALLEYSRVLGARGHSDSVTIPILERDGSPGAAIFLIGPASQIVVKGASPVHEELVDEGTVTMLRDRIGRFTPPTLSPEMTDWI